MFDRVHRRKLIKILKTNKLTEELVTAIRIIFENIKPKALTSDRETEE